MNVLRRTGLLEASLDPLRQPAQLAVTVERVGAESPANTRRKSEKRSIRRPSAHKRVAGGGGGGGGCTYRWDRAVRWLKAPSGTVERSLPWRVLQERIFNTCVGFLLRNDFDQRLEVTLLFLVTSPAPASTGRSLTHGSLLQPTSQQTRCFVSIISGGVELTAGLQTKRSSAD